MTGSYSNYFNIYDRTSKNEVILQADKSAFKKRASTTKNRLTLGRTKTKKEEISADSIDFSKKILHSSWHPKENSVAIAATNNLFLFSTL